MKFKQDALSVEKSEFIFTIDKTEIKDCSNINPQHYSPHLNDALTKILDFDNKDNWSTTTVGQLEAGIKIFMGPRWNSANLKVDNPDGKPGMIPYLTANGALELRRFTVKWLNANIATSKQKQYMKQLKVEEGDILISRSGTIGKVTYATRDIAKNYLVSDDLIRVRVSDKKLRAYLMAYFTSKIALSLMLLDEYGSVQQHLQPRHIQQMIIPIPNTWEHAKSMIDIGEKFIDAMEKMSVADSRSRKQGFDFLVDSLDENK